jgi:serine/threonine-protein kinase
MSKENLCGRTIAGYRLLDFIGEGGTATVYRAEHDERGVSVVKVLKQRMRNDQTAVKRFLREAGYGSRVDHPGIVKTFEYGDEDGLYFLALEWVAGEPLADYVDRMGRLKPELVQKIITQLADGLMAAHAEGIIHRDLKPENIMFDPETDGVKLLDFGIARDAQQDSAERLTRTGFFVGTLNYVAPEALSGELVGEAADTYSLATIAYYLLTGRHPYSGRTPREIFQQLLTQPPTPLNEAVSGLTFSDAMEGAVMRALSREPGERQSSVKDFGNELATAATDVSASAVPRAPQQAAAAEQSPSDQDSKGVVGKIRSLFGGKKDQ